MAQRRHGVAAGGSVVVLASEDSQGPTSASPAPVLVVPTQESSAESAEEMSAGLRLVAEEPVTVVFSRQVRPECEAAFQEWARGALATAATFPGHLGAEVLHTPGTGQWHTVYRFRDPASMEAWEASPQRARLVARVEPLIEHTTVQQASGVEGWFVLPGGEQRTVIAPPKWKMTAATWVGMFPITLLMQGVIVPRLGPYLLVRVVIYVFTVGILMTFLLMPPVTSLLRRWLFRPREAAAQPRKLRPLGVAWKPAAAKAVASGESSTPTPSARSTVSRPRAPSRTASARASTAGLTSPPSSVNDSRVRPPRST